MDQERTIANLPADFLFEVYQGEDLTEGSRPRFSELFAQGKPVILNFWAALCIPCRIEMPHFQRIYEQRAHEFIMFGLDVGPFTLLGTSDDGKAVLQEFGITYPTGAPIDGEVLTAYDVLGMPTTVFIKPDGTVFRTWVGLLKEEKINEILDDLVSQSQGL
jgi:thiol-disulfide isomerase/thioredoxin